MSVAERKAERPFSAPWEAQVFALAVKLSEAGVFTWSEWTKTLGAELSAQPQRPYYESWLAALERIAEGHGTMTGAERLARIEAWDRAARATPHGQPILLENAENRSGPSFDFSPV
ncbi:MAG: nitrile hydratase accessory protein [Rhizobiales bacterium]|nr:nitrile hydratase accessory protein [Hyphomicrobiales bacterium]